MKKSFLTTEVIDNQNYYYNEWRQQNKEQFVGKHVAISKKKLIGSADTHIELAKKLYDDYGNFPKDTFIVVVGMENKEYFVGSLVPFKKDYQLYRINGFISDKADGEQIHASFVWDTGCTRTCISKDSAEALLKLGQVNHSSIMITPAVGSSALCPIISCVITIDSVQREISAVVANENLLGTDIMKYYNYTASNHDIM